MNIEPISSEKCELQWILPFLQSTFDYKCNSNAACWIWFCQRRAALSTQVEWQLLNGGAETLAEIIEDPWNSY